MHQDTTNTPQARPIRILHIVSGDLWAGAEVQIFQLLREFKRSGTVLPRVVLLNPGMLGDKLRSADIEVDILDESQSGFLALLWRIKAIVASWQPAVVHTHRRKEHILGGLAGRLAGVPVVATIHGQSEFVFPWSNIRQRLLSLAEMLIFKYAHCELIAVSSELTTHLPATSNICVILNGIDVNSVRQAALEDTDIKPTMGVHTIAFVGRLVPVKRVDKIIEAMALLNRRDSGVWRLWIVGDGPARTLLEKQASLAGMTQSVSFFGFQPNPITFMNQADALILASEHEGLPMTALEALALGVPVVSPQIGGLTTLINESAHGALIPEVSPREIAATLTRLFSGSLPTQHRSISRLPQKYTIAKTAERMQELYQRQVMSLPSNSTCTPS